MKIGYLGLLIISVILGSSLLLSSCAQPAPSPVPTSSPAPTGAPSPKADPLADIIAGAKKEGTALTALTASYTTPDMLQALSNAIKQKYGVELNIKATGTADMGAMVAKATMEYQSKATPEYDLQTLGSDYTPSAMKSGAFEPIDWKVLAPAGTPVEVMPQNPEIFGGIIYYSDLTVLQYNPNKVKASEAPKKLSDLADPKWKGRLGIIDYTNYWARWAWVLGKDYVTSNLTKIIQTNKPMIQLIPAMVTKLSMGEVDLAMTSNSQFEEMRAKNIPVEFRPLDFVEIRAYNLLVRKNAEHPNAAKLIAVFLGSPDGFKFSQEIVKKGCHLFPGNRTYDGVQDAKKAGIPVWGLEDHPTLLKFITSPDYDKYQAEIKVILDGGKK